jgi:probable rRNA maturation factor
LLCTHGILHLLGFDHAEPDEEKEMFGLQRDLLAAWKSTRDVEATPDSTPRQAGSGS